MDLNSFSCRRSGAFAYNAEKLYGTMHSMVKSNSKTKFDFSHKVKNARIIFGLIHQWGFPVKGGSSKEKRIKLDQSQCFDLFGVQ